MHIRGFAGGGRAGRLTGADRTRVYSPAVSRVRSPLRPPGRSNRGGVLARQDSTPYWQSQSPVPARATGGRRRRAFGQCPNCPRKGACTRGYRTPVTAGLTPYPNPNAPPDADHTCTQASKDTGGCGEFESRRSSYISAGLSACLTHTAHDQRTGAPALSPHTRARRRLTVCLSRGCLIYSLAGLTV